LWESNKKNKFQGPNRGNRKEYNAAKESRPPFPPSQLSTNSKMPAYELRSGGDVKNKKQSMADLKYRRLTELNSRLKEDLDRPRVKVSEAALS
jgi:hypothetical protein